MLPQLLHLYVLYQGVAPLALRHHALQPLRWECVVMAKAGRPGIAAAQPNDLKAAHGMGQLQTVLYQAPELVQLVQAVLIQPIRLSPMASPRRAR